MTSVDSTGEPEVWTKICNEVKSLLEYASMNENTRIQIGKIGDVSDEEEEEDGDGEQEENGSSQIKLEDSECAFIAHFCKTYILISILRRRFKSTTEDVGSITRIISKTN